MAGVIQLNGRKVERARLRIEHDEPEQHRERAKRRHEERLVRADHVLLLPEEPDEPQALESLTVMKSERLQGS